MVLNTQNECLSQGFTLHVYYKMTIFILKVNALNDNSRFVFIKNYSILKMTNQTSLK